MPPEVTDILVKVLSPHDVEDIRFAIKATVYNLSVEENVNIQLQGLDEEGFELATVHLNGTVGIGKTRTLTTRDTIDSDLYKKIAIWQVK